MRLFVALELPDELRTELERLADVLAGCPSLRVVKPMNIHLTLKFLGEIRDEQQGKVTAALSSIAFRDARLSTTKTGTFPRVLWVGVKLTKELAQLQRAVQRAVRPFALYDPRPFQPHLTVARFDSLTLDEQRIIDKIVKEKRIDVSWKANSFTLFRSLLTPDGPVYVPMARFGARKLPS